MLRIMRIRAGNRANLVRLAVLLTCAAGVARAVSFSWAHREVIAPYSLQIDGGTYDQLAADAVRRGSLGGVPVLQPPGYIAYLAALYGVFGHTWTAPKLAACLLLAGMTWMAWRLGRHLFDDAAGALGAVMVA
jgi:hypothetical protein